MNLEQEIAPAIGVFARYGWSDGKTEAWAFTQIDRSASGGIVLNGRLWKRKDDVAGAAAVRNFLTGDDRRFLAAGGLGFIIGDGRLNYSPETIAETYYSLHVIRRLDRHSGVPVHRQPCLQPGPRPGFGRHPASALGKVAITLDILSV